MIDEEIHKELINALTTTPKTAKELKKELKLNVSTKAIGKTMKRLAVNHSEIKVRKYQGIHLYSVKASPVTPPSKPSDESPTEPSMESSIPSENIEHSLKTIIEELKSDGVDVQEVCYIALRDKKNAVDTERQYVETNAPTFKEAFDKMKEKLRKALNQIEDLKDESNRLLSQRMLATSIEARKAGVT